MQYLVRDAIWQAREIIQDTHDDPYRHSDEKLIGYFNNAVADAWRLRPDLFVAPSEASLGLAHQQYSVVDLDIPFPLEDQYFTSVVMFIAGWVGMGDDEFANDNRAITLIKQFEFQLTGGKRG